MEWRTLCVMNHRLCEFLPQLDAAIIVDIRKEHFERGAENEVGITKTKDKRQERSIRKQTTDNENPWLKSTKNDYTNIIYLGCQLSGTVTTHKTKKHLTNRWENAHTYNLSHMQDSNGFPISGFCHLLNLQMDKFKH